jgi:hypothetical protein
MASVASQLIEEVIALAQSVILAVAQEICADCTYIPKNLRIKEIQEPIVVRCQVIEVAAYPKVPLFYAIIACCNRYTGGFK